MSTSKKAALSLGAITLVAGIGAYAASENPFAIQSLSTGYQVADHHEKGHEGKCGTGKCGAEKAKEGKCGNGKCGAEKAKEGKCGGEKAKEGKCGAEKAKEGKCGH